MFDITESESRFNDLEKMSVNELLQHINNEDRQVPLAVQKAIPQIEKLIEEIVPRIKNKGRLFYIGAGTSGRLGILDASECPPTFGVPDNIVIGIIAGGDKAIRGAVEFAEDKKDQAWKDLKGFKINVGDTVIGIAASGRTPYVMGGIEECNKNNILTGCITCNVNTPLAAAAKFPIEVVVGSEFVTGSTRMKAGTAQKMILNMISTSLMIKLGRVKGNKMVDMQLSNNKLVKRGIKILVDELKIEVNEAIELLRDHGNVRKAIDWYKKHA
jgi:N-acetylmuramic acid 6-phosphate etherase